MLSDTEKTQVRFYLGQSSLFRYLNPRLEGVFGSIDSDAETIVRKILSQLQQVDAQLYGDGVSASYATTAVGVKAVEEIQFQSGVNVTVGLRQLGRGLVGRLSALLGVPVYADVYGENGWPGDRYSALGGMGNGGGNIIPLG